MVSTPPQNKRARLATPPRPAVANDGLLLLPTELLSEILLRLPAKELCRLRLVCRSWCALTHDPDFTNAHSSPRHPLVARLHESKSGQTCVVELADPYSGRVVRRKRACRLVEFGRSPYKRSPVSGLVCVWQRSHEACLLNTDTGGVTVLHTVRDDFVYVVGRVPSTGECKLLRYDALVCAVAKLGGGHGGNKIKWRKRAEPPGGVSPLFSDRAVVGGVVCFLLRRCVGGRVALFDLATEEWGPVTLQGPPPPMNERRCDKKLASDDLQVTEMDGCLVMAHGDCETHSMDLWFLVDMDKGDWTKRYSIRCPPVWKRKDYQWIRPWVVLDNGTVLLWAELKEVLKAYDPRTNTCTDLTAIESHHNYVGMLKVSLLCLGKSKSHPSVLEESSI